MGEINYKDKIFTIEIYIQETSSISTFAAKKLKCLLPMTPQLSH